MGKQYSGVRVGIFFDGTGNNQANAAQPPSNIALLHGLYPQGEVGDQAFIKLYVEGVGTTTGAPDSLYAQGTGRGATGVQARVEQALARAGEQLRLLAVPERVEFDLFGFSRGAAAARQLANRLGSDEGLPTELQRARAINFIGLFDTVAAIVEPLRGHFDPADARLGDLCLGLPEGIARQVVQLVARDEQRHNFALVRSGNDIIVPGAHSDIGGGYPQSMLEQVLLNKPFSSRVTQATPAERTAAYAKAQALLADLGDPRPRVLSWEVPVSGGRAQRDEAQKHVYAAAYREREVSGHLARVYLSIMRELGLRNGVPFLPLGGVEAHRVPDELRGISDTLHDHVLNGGEGLSAEQEALLQARFIHASAHWNALKGLRSSALDVLFVDRPAQGGRVVHENPVG
ncbi:phospholipase effector Tle1 domain-containing protein [Pseudomonas sp. NPDC089996]|uniref:phospholipase effector Tle1 domain-containing protein n=1 Tax=Pseudomonas sp. NPDC089996 TaxID=3364474 RepID=UPI00381DC4C5